MMCLDRLAVVTGANKGVGLEIARQLVPTMCVILACRDQTRGEQAAKAVGGIYEHLDVSDPKSIDAFAVTNSVIHLGSAMSRYFF